MSSLYTPVLPRFRSRWACALQSLALICLLLQPLTLSSSWVDTDSDTMVDSWDDGATLYSLAQLDALSTDIDGDNATNAEELQYGSNPFVMDTDGDGLNDGDEIHSPFRQRGKTTPSRTGTAMMTMSATMMIFTISPASLTQAEICPISPMLPIRTLMVTG